MHTYKPAEVATCLNSRRVVFIGGDSTRDLFNTLVNRVDATFHSPDTGREVNLLTTIANVRFEFIWDPYLKSANLAEIAAGYDTIESRPALTIIGPGHEFLRNEQNITSWPAYAAELMGRFGGTPAQKNRQSDALVFVPFLQPELSGLSAAEQDIFSAASLKTANEVIVEQSKLLDVDAALAFELVTQIPDALKGFQPAPKASAVMSDLLLNRRCNAGLPKHYPYASTCCNEYPAMSWLVFVAFVFACVAIPLAYFVSTRGHTIETSAFLRLMPAPKYYGPIFTLGVTVALCYYCDRTNIFGKEHKQTSASQFFIIMAILIAGSLLTLHTADKDLPFLNRDQTDEWKGWMQVAILVYHYVGVSKTEYIYNYMRVMPTSYLFMTGFGHTVYFLKKNDYSFKRFVATMLRLNLLNVILAYAMGNDWLLYYFAPLVTWNFFVLFGIMWVGHDRNGNSRFLLSKIVIGSILNTMFYKIPGVLEAAWWVLQTLFRMQGDMTEWRFRVTLDQYSMMPGMIAAIIFVNYDSYSWPKTRSFGWMTKLAYAVSAMIMLLYAVFESSQPSKQVYNSRHTYVSWLPCCAFVLLRNATPWLRRTHNKFFAWFGRGSLETFLLQFHLWLAADTAGLLNVGLPHQRLFSVAVTTVFFLYISSLATNATGPVIEWIMGVEAKPVRPGLPTSFKSHPANLPQANGNGHAVEPSVLGLTEKNETITSALPINGQPTGKLETQGVTSTDSHWSKDLRIRVALILLAMALGNWVS